MRQGWAGVNQPKDDNDNDDDHHYVGIMMMMMMIMMLMMMMMVMTMTMMLRHVGEARVGRSESCVTASERPPPGYHPPIIV